MEVNLFAQKTLVILNTIRYLIYTSGFRVGDLCFFSVQTLNVHLFIARYARDIF